MNAECAALAAELAELRAAVDAFTVEWSWPGGDVLEWVGRKRVTVDRLRTLAAQPQGERGKALLAEHAAMKSMLLKIYTERGWSHGSIIEMARQTLAAIDGANPPPWEATR